MIASSGAALIAPDALASMRELLFPRAAIITPNLPELEHLCGRTLRSTELIEEAATKLAGTYDCHILAKGGHTDDQRIIDTLAAPEGTFTRFEHKRIDTPHTHGTGCTLSSAIATLIAHGQPLEHAVKFGREFTLEAIRKAPGFGKGNGPLGHQAMRALS